MEREGSGKSPLHASTPRGDASVLMRAHVCANVFFICSAKIQRIADEIAKLTLLETVDLTAALKDVLKLTDKCVMAADSLWGLLQVLRVGA